MNRKEWKELCEINTKEAYYWYNKARKILLSKEFESFENCDKDAKVIHHLIETEEQIRYNDEHYEMFGFELDENGNEVFNYGKYVVFWTKEHHNEYHRLSDITRKKLSESLKLTFSTEEQKAKRSAQRRSEWNDERKLKYSVMFSGENNRNYGKKASDELRKRLSDSHKGIKYSEESKIKRSQSLKEHYKLNPRSRETCNKISIAISGENNPNYGRVYSDKERAYLSNKSKASREAVKKLYNVYKQNGGKNTWNVFQAAIKSGDICFEITKPSVLLNKTPNIEASSNKVPFKVTKDRAAMYKIYRSFGGKLKWNEFQSYYKQYLNLINSSNEPVQIKTGDKLVQFMYLPIAHGNYVEITDDEFKSAPQTARGTGGFGSSGSN